jgi:hypothetical protein
VQGIVKPMLDLGIRDFQLVLDHLKEEGYYLVEGEFRAAVAEERSSIAR